MCLSVSTRKWGWMLPYSRHGRLPKKDLSGDLLCSETISMGMRGGHMAAGRISENLKQQCCWMHSLSQSANICWMTTVLLALYSAWSYSRKQKIFPHGAYILARDTDKSSTAPHYYFNYSFCKCCAGGCGSTSQGCVYTSLSPSFSSPSSHNLDSSWAQSGIHYMTLNSWVKFLLLADVNLQIDN